MADTVTNQTLGAPESAQNKTLEGAASMLQDIKPVKRICAHLNAFHAYADKPGQCVEANHFCSHLNEDVRQCVLYDSPEPNARLIGVEYMITPRLYETLDQEERRLWHSHVYEVKSGMLIMPRPKLAPQAVWEAAENKEMEQVVHLYGKVYHLWQVDQGHQLPLGPPKLMTSYTEDGQFDFQKMVGDRDRRFGEDAAHKREIRKHIEEPTIHPDADFAWKR